MRILLVLMLTVRITPPSPILMYMYVGYARVLTVLSEQSWVRVWDRVRVWTRVSGAWTRIIRVGSCADVCHVIKTRAIRILNIKVRVIV